MVSAPGATLSFVALAQNRAQALTHPLVLGLERVLDTVLEVAKPTLERAIDVRHHLAQRSRVELAGLLAYRFPELVQTLLARPPMAPFEVVAQKVESSSLAGIDDAGFGRV